MAKEKLDFPITFKSRAELMEFLTSGAPEGHMIHVLIVHDNGCPAPDRPCICQPEYVLEELTADSYQRGVEAEQWWRQRQQN